MKKSKLFRFLIVAGVLAVVLGLVYFAFVTTMPELLPVLERGQEAEIERYLRHSSSTGGLICTALLQFVQVLSVILPGAPLQIAAGIVYGAGKALAVCYGTYVAVNLLVFSVARKLRSKLDELLPANEGWLGRKLGFLKDSEMPVYMTAMATIIPLVPNGIIPYAAARTEMRFGQFAAAVGLGSLLPIAVMCTIGSRILAGDYLLAVLVFAGSLAIVALLTRFRVRIMGLAKRLLGPFTTLLLLVFGRP